MVKSLIQKHRAKHAIFKADKSFSRWTVSGRLGLVSSRTDGEDFAFALIFGGIFLGFLVFGLAGGGLLSLFLGDVAFNITMLTWAALITNELAQGIYHYNFKDKRLDKHLRKPLESALRRVKNPYVSSNWYYYNSADDLIKKLHFLRKTDLDHSTRALVNQAILDLFANLKEMRETERTVKTLQPLSNTSEWNLLYKPTYESLKEKEDALSENINQICKTINKVAEKHQLLSEKAAEERKQEKARLQAERELAKSKLKHTKIIDRDFSVAPSKAAESLSERLEAIEHVDNLLKK